MPSYQQILFQSDGLVATITLNRPDRLNAWTPVMEAEVASAISSSEESTSIRAVVITGSGPGFCSGADLTRIGAVFDAPAPALPGPDRLQFLWNCKKLLVAAINGPAAGVGLSVALHCDLRYIAEDASVTTAFARRGLIAEHGSAWLLPRLIGLQNATDLLVSARKVGAAEVAQMGLARLLPSEGFLTRVETLTAELVKDSSPRSVGIIRQQLRLALSQDYAAARILAHAEQVESFRSADFREGVSAFRERRPAMFTGE
jgi:enoyl-CoA hydratase/carnithine racemase